jgi:two-component system cell cycle response regulator
MALRVLLADESTNIKKVMQLALQDFGVEVKAVPVGLDVLSVASSFKPNIVFADVLLSKKSGYDVCEELKKDSLLKSVPVILMWSGFMELDESRFKSSKANDRLEKPFDAETLRSLVKKHVPVVNENVISNFLTFPKLPDILPSETQIKKASVPKTVAAPASVDLDDPEDFQQVPLPKNKSSDPVAHKSFDVESESWSSTNIAKVKINPIPDDIEFSQLYSEIDQPSSSSAPFGVPEVPVLKSTIQKPNEVRQSKQSPGYHEVTSAFQTERAEELLREEVHRVLMDVAWKIIPDIAERVIREEIEKLLQEEDRVL